MQKDKITTTMYRFLRDITIKNRRVIVTLFHIAETVLANYLAFFIRFEANIPLFFLSMAFTYLPVLIILRLIFYVRADLYKGIWSYSSVGDMVKIVKSVTIGSAVFFIMVRYLAGNASYPMSIYVFDCLLLIIISGGSRFLIRVFREFIYSPSPDSPAKKLLIIGAGDAGEAVIRDIKNNPKPVYEPIGFVDEDPYKKGLMIHGVPILGPVSMMPYLIETHRPEEILITLSSSDNNNIKKIYELCKPYNVLIKKLPCMNDILNGSLSLATRLGERLIEAGLVTEEKVQQALALQREEGGRLGSKLIKLGYITEEKLVLVLHRQFGIAHVRSISVEDLLQREPVRTNIESVRSLIENKPVLVTGAGGSIGSELCRQLRGYGPSNLILFDRYENTLFKIDLELRQAKSTNGKKHPRTITPVIGDICDQTTLEHVFSQYKPQVVFHAAAHKHVPLMEYNPIEAVKNNIFGTKNLIDITARYNVESFVMISTDKAVNPVSIMGATKRIAELLTISKNASSGTKFTTVRFGNVLGSNGSVVSVFREQLKMGGPLTVTHPDIKRFFMLIPEAVQLVLTAASLGKGGEIFVLDMGEQIKIIDLAENMIRLAGFIPNEEIKIEYSGLRPGEKLYEELLDTSETLIPTFHEKIRIAAPSASSICDLDECISEFNHVVRNYSAKDIVPVIQRLVPNFRPPAEVSEPALLQ
ncbi:MAG: polysaccharide biosynthesis protein [Nitrospirae bacterium]|nr:polysaccharide biosynthesis protein [Nitrospirota bacterium]